MKRPNKTNLLTLKILGFVAFLSGISTCSADIGALGIISRFDSPYLHFPLDIVHRPGVSEGTDAKDSFHGNLPPMGRILSKQVSIVEGLELDIDARPEDSTTPVDIELSVHERTSQKGDWVDIVSSNTLWVYMPLAVDYGYDFGDKPITLWERDPNDPNQLTFMGDVREAIDKSLFHQGERNAKTAVFPLADIDGALSEIPYFYAQVRFDVYASDLNMDHAVDGHDLAILANDWRKTGVPSDFAADITGPIGQPDGVVDYLDLDLFARNWRAEGLARAAAMRRLLITSDAGGSVITPGEGDFDYAYGSDVELAAAPEEGYRFLWWSGTAVDAGKVADPDAAETTVTVDAYYTLSAHFAGEDQRILSVSSGANGMVTAPGEGLLLYTEGTEAAIAAVADEGYRFVSWSGTAIDAGTVADTGSAETTVTVDADYTLVANFAAMGKVMLTLTAGEGGSISGQTFDDFEGYPLGAFTDAEWGSAPQPGSAVEIVGDVGLPG